jgi:ribosomal protein S18 acetylase RimI-like enzyme
MPSIQLVPSRDSNLLLPLLGDAEEGDDRIMRAIEDPAMTGYIAQSADTIIGAVVMHWGQFESEIIYIATEPSLRGQGYGKAIRTLYL